MGSSRKRGFSVLPEKLALIEQKMSEMGIESREALAEAASLSEDVIKKLFSGGNVDRSTIEAIARKALKIEPIEIVTSETWYPQRKANKTQASTNINWKRVCQEVLKRQEKLLLTSYPLGTVRRVPDVYVPLELVERSSKPRLEQDFNPANFSVREQEEKTTPISHGEFFESVLKGQSPKSQGRRIAIIGEPGAGKTTLLQEISTRIDGIPIWIDLASLKQNDTVEEYLLHDWLRSSLSVIRQYAPAAVPNLLEPSAELKQAFAELFEQEQVWLLLDGADEMSVELGQPLNWVAQQFQQAGWVARAKVVLTSRLNLWSSYGDRLPGFDTYRNLDFAPEQVTEFIDKWFAENPNNRDKLKEDLERSSDRIKSLIRNPLRLTLLCLTWKGIGDKLPETKAGLYQRLIRSHYEHQWKTKPEDFARFEDEEEQNRLNQWLGALSKTALDGQNPHFQESRFRFRESALTHFAKQFDQGTDLFRWSIKIGWLNQVGLPSVDERDADEPVYAFLHPTFQEYFAALAIADWHEFLNHIPDNPHHPEAKYRVFEPHWQEVILLWIGRSNTEILKDPKNTFIKALIDFEDDCQELYGYRAYFAAGEYIAEFANCDYADEIIKKIVEWAFGFFDLEKRQWMTHYLFSDLALSIIKKTNKIKTKPELIYLFNYLQNEEIKIAISQSNGEGYYEKLAIQILLTVLEISPEDLEAIIHITKLVNVSDSFICQEFKGVETSQLIERIKTSPFFNRRKVQNNTADLDENSLASSQEILNLVKSLADIQDGDPRHGEVLSSLDKITFRNPNALTAFIEILEASLNPEIIVDNYVVFVTVQHINRIGITSLQMADVLMQLLLSNIDFGHYATRLWALSALISVSARNRNVFDFLTELVHEKQDWAIRINSYRIGVPRCVAVNGLGMIANKDLFPLVVSNLKEFLQDESYNSNRMLQADCYSTLFHCAQNMSYPDFYQAWHHPNFS